MTSISNICPGLIRHPVGAGFQPDRSPDAQCLWRPHGRIGRNWYERIFNFREIRYFDIKGEYTGLTSRAMTAPDGKIRIPLNEEGKAGGGQIEEFLRASIMARGSSISRFICDDLIGCLGQAPKALGVPFMTAPPETYYKMLDERLPGHGEPADELEGARHPSRRDHRRTAIRACCCRSSLRRKSARSFSNSSSASGDEGFGEGNFKALFESIERDQIERGVLGGGRMSAPFTTGGIHHVAYRCKDAKETVEWYERVLGMDLHQRFCRGLCAFNRRI